MTRYQAMFTSSRSRTTASALVRSPSWIRHSTYSSHSRMAPNMSLAC